MRTIRPTRPARTRLPVPPWVWGLAVLMATVEAVGWATRVWAAPSAVAASLSMDAPYSLPRVLVASLFLMTGIAAAAGAQRLRGRRTWWTAIAVISVSIAAIKMGSTVHTRAVQAIGGYEHPVRSLTVFGGLALAVLGWLYWVSRGERRDRRRVLLWLGGYAFASVGVSTLSASAEALWGYESILAATAALVEEGAEALTAVGVLFAVLVGVAPRLVLPREWTLSRPTDAGSPAPEDWREFRRSSAAQ